MSFPLSRTCDGSHSHSGAITPFAYGFRPFFLAALAYGLVSVVIWVVIRQFGVAPLPHMAPQFWHGHEMLFGFVTAAIAGFLLTAVPSWTQARGYAGWPLVLLSAVWVAGRLAFGFSSYLPMRLVAVLELAFLPALAAMIAVPLLRTRNRNLVMLFVLFALWLVDAVFLCAVARGDAALASNTLRVTLDIVLLLITIVGGRIVPAFTANALRKRGIDASMRNDRWLGGIAIGAMVLLTALDIFAPSHPAVATAAAVAALAQAARLSGWGGLRALKEPIVWVLHLGYLWLPIWLALRAEYLISGSTWASAWLHALALGVAATMVVAVITRASLGHTGRPLVVSKSVAFAYGVLGVAALARAAVPALSSWGEWGIRLTAILWIAAFTIVLFNYAPILLRARVDGRQG